MTGDWVLYVLVFAVVGAWVGWALVLWLTLRGAYKSRAW